MQKEYIQKLPEWWRDNQYYDLCLSDDFDSLWSCTLLQQLKGWDINYFYDFSNIYYINNNSNKIIGVDIDLCKGRCFSNHVTMLSALDTYNTKAINLNIADRINTRNYFYKYSASTVLMLYSLYNIPLPDTELGKMILLSVDSAFLGYYYQYKECNQANYHYLVEVLEFQELYDILKQHKQLDFKNLIDKYNLKEKIYIDEDGKLQTNIKLKELSEVLELPFFMPKNRFHFCENYETRKVWINDDDFTLAKINKKIFSMALTRRDKVSYSI